MIYRTKEEVIIKRKLTRLKQKKVKLQNEVALINFKTNLVPDSILILRRDIILKDIREIDVAITEHYRSLRTPKQSFNLSMYGRVETFPDLQR